MVLSNKQLRSDRQRLIRNFFSLSTLEIVNYVVPLITLPYLVRVLGPSNFGKVAFAQVFVQYFVIITDYGFYLSGPKNISINRDNLDKISAIFSSIMTIKGLLLILNFLIFALLIFSIPKFSSDKVVFIFSFGLVIGDLLFPAWFFQGMETMKYITLLYFYAKLFFLVAVFVFIRSPGHYIYVPLFNSLGMIFTGIYSQWLISRKFGVRFILPSINDVRQGLKSGWHFFISTLSINAYTYSNTFILGLLTDSAIVGYYSAAEKIIRAVQRMHWAVSRAVYPYVNKIASQSKEQTVRFLRKLLLLVGSSFFIISLIIFIFAKLIVLILLGEQYRSSIIVLQILSFLPFIISLSNIFGVQTMLAFNLEKKFSQIMSSTALVNIALAFILTPFFKHIGVSVAVLLTEIYVAIVTYFQLKKYGISYIKIAHRK